MTSSVDHFHRQHFHRLPATRRHSSSTHIWFVSAFEVILHFQSWNRLSDILWADCHRSRKLQLEHYSLVSLVVTAVSRHGRLQKCDGEDLHRFWWVGFADNWCRWACCDRSSTVRRRSLFCEPWRFAIYDIGKRLASRFFWLWEFLWTLHMCWLA